MTAGINYSWFAHMTLSSDDLNAVAALLDTKVPALVEKATEPYFQAITTDLDTVRTTMDSFLTIVRRHEEEWIVLRAQHNKLRDFLIKKGIASEDDLAIA